MGDDVNTLVIKRYASRRLYNSETSEYVTLQEIAELIRSGRDVRIVDRKTGDDLTRQYLVQIIADHEAKGEELLPLSILMEVVRTYNDKASDVVPKFLDQSFQMLQNSQSQVMESMKAMSDPMYAVRDLERRQREAFNSFMEYWTTGGSAAKDEKPKQEEESEESELDQIKRQLAELQSKISSM